jgi:hypothetical protein
LSRLSEDTELGCHMRVTLASHPLTRRNRFDFESRHRRSA